MVLRIALFEEGEERSVREVLETRGVVGHGVGRSWDVEHLLAVSFLSLVGAVQVAQMGGRSV